jgi:hypothetical protein
MSRRPTLGRRITRRRDPVQLYRELFEFDIDKYYQFHLVERIIDGALSMKKTFLLEDCRMMDDELGHPDSEIDLVRDFNHPNLVFIPMASFIKAIGEGARRSNVHAAVQLWYVKTLSVPVRAGGPPSSRSFGLVCAH